MTRCLWLAAGALSMMLCGGVAAHAQTELRGQTSGGAHFWIMVPDEWEPADGLVIWNHGFDLSPIGPVDDLGPLAALQLSEGYAVAASSYSLTGWALFETVSDNEEMVRAFEAEFGVPDQVIVTGASLGGIVTAQAIEQADLGNVVGAMPICGAVGGSRVWDGGVDLRLIYDAICEDVPGAAIPGGANGLPFPPDPTFGPEALGLAVNACFGLLQPPGTQTMDQIDRLARIVDATGLPESFILTDMGFSTFGLADLVYDPRKLAGGQAFVNTDVGYGDAQLDADIARVTADQAVRQRLFDHFTPQGRVGDTKIVSIHTDKDGLVIVENQSSYAEVVPADQLTIGIVVEDEPSHCGFTEGELVSAWESLRGWVAGQSQPTASSLQATCEALVAGGLAMGPCRIDPGFMVPEIDGRVRPRSSCVADADTLCLNEGRFRAEVDWEDAMGRTGSGRTLASGGDRSGAFYFFDPDVFELTVKAIDGRERNGRFWIFFGSLTNTAFALTVTDTVTGLEKVYENPLGSFSSVGDTAAF